MFFAAAATAFWLAISPQIGVNSGVPNGKLMSYGGTAAANLGPVGLQFRYSKTPFEEIDASHGSTFDITRTEGSNIDASASYTLFDKPLTFKLGVNYHSSRSEYFHTHGRSISPWYGKEYTCNYYGFLVTGIIAKDGLIAENGPSFTAWGGIGPDFAKREGREWVWPYYDPIEVTPLTGDEVSLEGGLGIATIQRLFPHIAITGTADIMFKITELSGGDLPEIKDNQFAAYIGPTVYF